MHILSSVSFKKHRLQRRGDPGTIATQCRREAETHSSSLAPAFHWRSDHRCLLLGWYNVEAPTSRFMNVSASVRVVRGWMLVVKLSDEEREEQLLPACKQSRTEVPYRYYKSLGTLILSNKKYQ